MQISLKREEIAQLKQLNANDMEELLHFVEDEPSFFNEKGRFLHNVMGDYLINKFNACKINSILHTYDNGVYRPEEEIIHGHMVSLIPSLTDAKRKEVCKYMKVNPLTPKRKVSPPHFIPFKTKIYNLKNDCFIDYGPEYVFLNRFPYDYLPGAAPQPLVLKTIAEIADNNPEVISLLYEAMGNCFYLLNSFRGAVMLYGKHGNNGKSTLLNMITQLLGRENTSFLSLQDTAEKFRLPEIYGKVANIGDDISSAYLPDSANFKKLVTGEPVMAERKGEAPFAFKSFAKMFFSMNSLPAVSDKSKAFFGRILLIPLNNDFSRSCDVGLKDRQWTREEMEFLTTLAMDGLKRLRKQGGFTLPEAVREAIKAYEKENNPVAEFLDDFGDIDRKPIIEVYNTYRIWSADNGHKNMYSRTKFTREVLSLNPGYKSKIARHAYYGGHPGRCFAKDI